MQDPQFTAAQLYRLAGQTPHVYIHITKTGRIDFANAAAYDLLDIEYTSSDNCRAIESLPGLMEQIQDSLSANNDTIDYQSGGSVIRFKVVPTQPSHGTWITATAFGATIHEHSADFERLFQQSPIPQWLYDPDNLRFLLVNEAALDLYGYTRAEFVGMTILDIRPVEEIPTLTCLLSRDLNLKLHHECTVTHRRKDGQTLYAYVKGKPAVYDGKNARHVSIVDLTNEHMSAEALSHSEKRYQLLVQGGSDLVTIFDRDGTYKYASPTALNILGLSAEKLIGKNVFDFIHPDDRPIAKLQFKLVETENRVLMPPFRYRHFNGETRWMETIITNRLTEPLISGIITNSRDVTERITREIESQKHLERFNTVSKATSDAIWELDLVTQLITWNRGLKGLFGHNFQETSMDWWKQMVHPDDLPRILSHFEQSILKGISNAKLEYRFNSAHAGYKNVLDRSFIHYDLSGKAVKIIGSMQDVSEEKKYITEIEDQNAKLREIARIQSHDLRAPLTTLMGLMNLIAMEEPDGQSIHEILPMLQKSAEEIDEVIRVITKKAVDR